VFVIERSFSIIVILDEISYETWWKKVDSFPIELMDEKYGVLYLALGFMNVGRL